VSSLTGTLVHIVKRATVPTQQQIANMEYKLDTPYSVVNRINPVSGNEEFTYYFWVEDRRSNIPVLGGPEGNITLTTIEAGLRSIPTPYMIPNNVVDISTVGFADLFATNSPHDELRMSYEFPFVYNQVIVKGLAGTVQSDEDYTLRFTRDFALRDRLANMDPDISELQRKNIHWEWKLFREKQFNKIDIELWNAVIESILGFEYDGDPLTGDVEISPTPTPSPSPSPTSTPAAVTPSATPTNTPPVTPTLTPNPTATPTITPSVTSTPVIQPTPTPSITPSNTPVASPTPSPAGQVGLFTQAGDPFVGTLQSTSLAFLDFSSQADASVIFYNDTGGTAFNVFRTQIVIADNLLWFYPPSGDSSDYDIRLNITSGSITNGSTGVWLNLGTTREWELIRTTIGTSTASGTIQIRDANTLVVLDTINVSFTATADILGGIGEGGFIF
jgi:hypothetical protein